MTKKDLIKLKKLLEHIKDPDGYVKEMIAVIDRNLAIYESMRGQMKDQYYRDEI